MLPSDAATKKRRSRNLSASPYANLHVRRGECARLSLLERLRNSLRTTPRTLAIIALQTLTRTFPADAATKKLRSRNLFSNPYANPHVRRGECSRLSLFEQLGNSVRSTRRGNQLRWRQSLLEPLCDSVRPTRRQRNGVRGRLFRTFPRRFSFSRQQFNRRCGDLLFLRRFGGRRFSHRKSPLFSRWATPPRTLDRAATRRSDSPNSACRRDRRSRRLKISTITPPSDLKSLVNSKNFREKTLIKIRRRVKIVEETRRSTVDAPPDSNLHIV